MSKRRQTCFGIFRKFDQSIVERENLKAMKPKIVRLKLWLKVRVVTVLFPINHDQSFSYYDNLNLKW